MANENAIEKPEDGKQEPYMVKELRKVRDLASRATLGNADARVLRGLFLDLLDVLLDDVAPPKDADESVPLNENVRQHPGVPATEEVLQHPDNVRMMPGAPTAHGPDNAGVRIIESSPQEIGQVPAGEVSVAIVEADGTVSNPVGTPVPLGTVTADEIEARRAANRKLFDEQRDKRRQQQATPREDGDRTVATNIEKTLKANVEADEKLEEKKRESEKEEIGNSTDPKDTKVPGTPVKEAEPTEENTKPDGSKGNG